MRRFLWIQTLLILAGTAVSYYYMGVFGAQSAAYGGGIALFSSLILSKRATRIVKSIADGSQYAKSSQHTKSSQHAKSAMGLLYIGVIQRYVFVLVGLGVGLGLLKFNAEPLLIVFAVAQLAYFNPWQGNE